MIPNYLSDMEKKRKEKEVIPDDFISDEELKEEENVFKPPKVVKHVKRPMLHKTDSGPPGNL